MIRRVVLALTLIVATATFASLARGDEFWGGSKKPKRTERDRILAEANEHLIETLLRARIEVDNSGGKIPRNWGRFVEDSARRALRGYERAIALGDDADVRFRAITAATFLDSNEGWEATIRHGEGFRAADPDDPREIGVAWDISIALSKIGMQGGPKADEMFARAIAEYDKWRSLIDEASPYASRDLARSYVNAAELLMTMGRLDEALVYYQQGRDLDTSEPLAYYGLAVAYDRDGQWQNAKTNMIEALGRDTNPRHLAALDQPNVFFVPDGDIHYYKALGYHVLGKKEDAIAKYRLFLSECKETKYAERAREHLRELGAGELE